MLPNADSLPYELGDSRSELCGACDLVARKIRLATAVTAQESALDPLAFCLGQWRLKCRKGFAAVWAGLATPHAKKEEPYEENGKR